MRKFFRAAATAVALSLAGASLAGCQTAEQIVEEIKAAAGFTVTQSQVDAFRTTYNGLLKFAAEYGEARRCNTGQNYFYNGCHDPATLVKLQGIKNAVSGGLVNVQAAIDRGDNAGAVGLFNTVKAALLTGQGIVTALSSPPK